MKTVIFEKRLSNVPKKNRGDLGHPRHWHRLAGIYGGYIDLLVVRLGVSYTNIIVAVSQVENR